MATPSPLHCSCGRPAVLAYEGEGRACGCVRPYCWSGPVRRTPGGAVRAWNAVMRQARPAVNDECPAIIYTLPYPPSINHYWLRKASGKVFLSAAAKKYREAVGYTILEAGQQSLGTEPVEIAVRAWPPDRRVRDDDNILKALYDALEHARVFENDYQIGRQTVERSLPVKGGKVEVRLWPLLPLEEEGRMNA